ncbi:hypothetical protein E2C01_013498 [Portunus trituberculatus]|uniref:Uncharacterized protein n=1 Tax=Portunus trituberculatus TaxID=210409 RepID=A0A5B7DGS8_PORTR|nr:hypothetical protein [Portunus trituberculatus]
MMGKIFAAILFYCGLIILGWTLRGYFIPRVEQHSGPAVASTTCSTSCKVLYSNLDGPPPLPAVVESIQPGPSVTTVGDTHHGIKSLEVKGLVATPVCRPVCEGLAKSLRVAVKPGMVWHGDHSSHVREELRHAQVSRPPGYPCSRPVTSLTLQLFHVWLHSVIAKKTIRQCISLSFTVQA